jgi:hypothetical protein
VIDCSALGMKVSIAEQSIERLERCADAYRIGPRTRDVRQRQPASVKQCLDSP